VFEVLCEEVGLAPLDLREALPQRGRHPQVELLPGRAHHPPPGGRPAALTGSRRSPSYPPYAHHACSAGGERIKKGVRTGRAGPGELPRHAPYLATTRGARRRRFAPEVRRQRRASPSSHPTTSRRPPGRRTPTRRPRGIASGFDDDPETASRCPGGLRAGLRRRDPPRIWTRAQVLYNEAPFLPAPYFRPLSFQRRTLVVGRAGAGLGAHPDRDPRRGVRRDVRGARGLRMNGARGSQRFGPNSRSTWTLTLRR